MERSDPLSASNCAASPESARRNINGGLYETHQHMNKKDLFESLDGQCKMTEDDNIAAHGIDNREILSKTEKEHATFSNNAENNSPLMFTEDNDCGKISPIRARDVYPVVDGFRKSDYITIRSLEAESIDFKEATDPFQGPPYSPCLFDNHSSYNSHELCASFAFQGSDEYCNKKDANSSNSNVDLDKKMTIEITHKDNKESAKSISDIALQNEVDRTIEFPYGISRIEENISNVEKIDTQPMILPEQDGREIANSNRETKSREVFFNDSEGNHAAIGEGMSSFRGYTLAGLTLRMGEEKNTLGDCFMPDCSMGPAVQSLVADNLHRSWWKNVRKVSLPEVSAYEKQMNNMRNFGCADWQKNLPCLVNSSFFVERNEYPGKIEKNVEEKVNTCENPQVGSTPTLGMPSSVESSLKGNYPELNNGMKVEQSDDYQNVMETFKFSQEVKIDKFGNEIKAVGKLSLVGDIATEKSLPLNLFRNMGNVAFEEPCFLSKTRSQQFGKEILNEVESDDRFPPAKNDSGILSGIDCNEKRETAEEILEKFGTNTPEPIKKDLEDDIDMDNPIEEINLKNEIERLVDDIFAKKEAELFSFKYSGVKGSETTFEEHFEESQGELDIPAGVNLKEVLEKNMQPFFNLGLKDNKQLEKSSEVEQIAHHGTPKISDEELHVEKTEMGGILVVNQPKNVNAESNVLSMGNCRAKHDEKLIGKSNYIDLGKVEEDLRAFQHEKMEICDDQVSDHLLNGGKTNAQGIEYAAQISPGVSLSSGCKGSNVFNNCSDELKEIFVSMPPEKTNIICPKKNTMKDNDDCIDMKQSEDYPRVSVGGMEVTHSIPACTKALGDVTALIEGGPLSKVIEPVIGNKITPEGTVMADTTSLQALVPKAVEINTFSCGIEVLEANPNEFAAVANHEEDNGNHQPGCDVGRNVPLNEEIDTLEKGSLFCETQFKSDKDEIVVFKVGNTDKCYLENISNCKLESSKSTGQKNYIDNQDSIASLIGDDGDMIVENVIGTKNMSDSGNKRGSNFEIFSNGCNTIKSAVENKILSDKDSVMLVDSTISNDCLEFENNFCCENLENKRKESIVKSQIGCEISEESNYTKSLVLAELKVEESSGKIINTLSMNQQLCASSGETPKSKENSFGGENESTNDISSLSRLQNMKSALSQFNHEDDKLSEKIDAENKLNKPFELYENKFSHDDDDDDDTLGLDEMDVIEVPKMGVDLESGWLSSQKRKDYMISGIELIRDYSADDSEILDVGNGIESSLESHLGENNMVKEIQSIEENLKPSCDYMSSEFSEMGKLPDVQPTCLILEAANGEDDNLNDASDSKLCSDGKYYDAKCDDVIKKQSTVGPLSCPQDVGLLSESPNLSFSDSSNFDDVEERKSGPERKSASLPSSPAVYNEDKYILNPINHHKFDIVDCFPKLHSFGSLNSIHEESSESLVKDTQLEDKKREYGSHSEYNNAHFVDENPSLKNSHPEELDMYTVPRNTVKNVSDTVSKTCSLIDFERKITDDDDHQIVPDVTNEIPVEDYSVLTNDEISLVKSEKTENEENRMISNSGITDNSPFSLDMYLDTVLDEQLPPENKSCCECSHLVDAGCQTQLCGLLNIIHSCDCLATTLLSENKLKHSKFAGRKRELQALNLETLGPKSKKLKLFTETIASEILMSDTIPKGTDVLEKERIFFHQQQSSYLNHETKPISENIVEIIGFEASSKSVAHLTKISPENDWEEVCDLDDGVRKKELNDQKVPLMEIIDTGQEEIAPEMNRSIQDADFQCLSSHPKKIYGGSKVLRLGLSKRARLPRLHQQK